MKTESAIDVLNRDILLLEESRFIQFNDLKEQLNTTYESLKPINLIKSTFKDATEFPDIKAGIGKAAIGMASGYLLKKLIFESSANPLKKLAGVAFQALVTNVAAKNSDKIKETGINIFEIAKGLIMPKKKEIPEREEKNDDYDFGEK